jgi:hypothetical protein
MPNDEEEIMKYRQFIYDHFNLKIGYNLDGTGFAYGTPHIASKLYNFLASIKI